MKARSGMTQQRATRIARRKKEAPKINRRAEVNRRRNAVAGGKPDSSGQTQGQNGEQGNTTKPENSRALGKLSH